MIGKTIGSTALAVIFSIALAGAAALAASSGGGGGSSGGGGGGAGGGGAGGGGSGAGIQCREGLVPDALGQMCVPCDDGTVYDSQTKTCVTRSSGLIDDFDLYFHGRELAVAGHYQDALDALNQISNKDSMTLTMIGYATRKLGHTEEGIAIYHQALAIDPDNVNTREYLAEGYLATGRVDLAEAELDTIARICGNTTCEQYVDLQKAIVGEPVWN